MYGQKKTVLLAVLLLFVAFAFVYFVYFDMQDEDVNIDSIFSVNEGKKESGNKEAGKNSSDNSGTGENKSTQGAEEGTGDSLNLPSLEEGDAVSGEVNSGQNEAVSGSSTGGVVSENKESVEENEDETESGEDKASEEEESEEKSYQKLLTGMSFYTGSLSTLDKLELPYEYILRGDYESYFVFLGTGEVKIDEKVEKIGGNTVEIGSKKSINKNSLTGDKIVYVNIPEYEDEIVNILLFDDENKRFIEVKYDYYYKFKSYLKKAFK